MFQLAGWGVTEHKTTSDVLLHVDLPYVDYYTCLNDVQLVFQHYVTPDKFCAGYKNGKESTYFKFLILKYIQ